MPYKDPEKDKAYRQTPEYKAKDRAYQKKRREDPEIKEKEKEQQKIYRQSPEYKKSNRISNWKKMGVICDDFDELYERYLNTEFCEECKCKLTEDKINTKTTRCLDHCHTTGLFRNILCNPCNIKRG